MKPGTFGRELVTQFLSGQYDGWPVVDLKGKVIGVLQESRVLQALSGTRSLDGLQVEDVMTPRTVTLMLPAETTIQELLDRSDVDAFSRIPLYRDSRDNVVGYVHQRDVWKAVARSGKQTVRLADFMRPISFVPELATLVAALQQLLSSRESLAIATDEYGGVAGLLTLEDITETLLGAEIVDESDRFVDMRETALRLRGVRLERIRRLQEKQGPAPSKQGG